MKLTESKGQIVAQHYGDHTAGRYFYLHDRLGSVRLIIDSSGNVKNRYTYKPFGEVFTAETEETIGNPFGFTGQWYDAEIGEYFLRARMYDPHINRFTGRDPVFGEFQEPLTLHKYLYCGNNPINFTDINGKWALMLGGSLSGNINFTHQFLTEKFGLMGYYLGVLPLLCENVGLGSPGLGGTAGRGVFFGKGAAGWFGGSIGWLAGGGSIASSTGASLTFDIGFSPNAQKADDMGGWFTEYGGSVTIPAPVSSVFWFLTGGFTYAESDDGIDLYTLSGGPGYSSSWGAGMEGHIYRGYAWVTEW